jgi:hypothetical protein
MLRLKQSCQTPDKNPNSHPTGGSSAQVRMRIRSGRGSRVTGQLNFVPRLKVMRWTARNLTEGTQRRSSEDLHVLV